MRGGKPIPSYLKIVRGNPGRRPLNESEPKPVGNLDVPPDWLTAAQKEGWRYVIQHAPVGLLKRLDSALLVIWVVAEDLHRQAAESLAKSRSLLARGSMRQIVVSPYIAIMNGQALIMLKTASELGFSPVSRTRIHLPASTAANKFALLDDL